MMEVCLAASSKIQASGTSSSIETTVNKSQRDYMTDQELCKSTHPIERYELDTEVVLDVHDTSNGNIMRRDSQNYVENIKEY